MAVSVEQVKALNSKIEKLNTQRTKVNAQIEILQDRLEKELAKYLMEHDVQLKGKTLRETVKNVMAEQEKVASEIATEFELKTKVVTAIETGNISDAYRLLGIKEEEDEEESVEETTVESAETEQSEVDDDDFGIDLGDVELSVEDTDDLDLEDIEEEEVKPTSSKVQNLGSSMDEVMEELDMGSDDEEDDDDDFGFGDLLTGTKLSLD